MHAHGLADSRTKAPGNHKKLKSQTSLNQHLLVEIMNNYQIISLIISGIAALGTVGATVVALYLSNRQEKVNLKASVYKAVITGGPLPWPEQIAFSITNRSKFPVQIDEFGWTLPKSPRCLCMMLNPTGLLLNGASRFQYPFSIEPGKRVLLYMPWEKFESNLKDLASNDSDGIYHREVIKNRIKFYISTPRADKNILFNLDKKIMDTFIKSLEIKDKETNPTKA